MTSKQGALALKPYSPDWEKLRVICVGEATAEMMKNLGAMHIEIAEGYGETIFNVLEKYSGKWLYCRPKLIASSWPERAREAGIIIDDVIMYETQCNETMEKIAIVPNAVLIFTSPSSIECFCEHYELLASHDVVVIGKTTQKALPLGCQSRLAEKTTIESCVKAAKELAV